MKRDIRISTHKEEIICATITKLNEVARPYMHHQLGHGKHDHQLTQDLAISVFLQIESRAEQEAAKTAGDYFNGVYGPPIGSRLVKLIGAQKAFLCARAYEEWREVGKAEKMQLAEAINSHSSSKDNAAKALVRLGVDPAALAMSGYVQRLCKGIVFLILNDNNGALIRKS